MGDLLRASRPFSWINTCLPFLAVAWSLRHSATLPIVLGALYFLGPYNLLMYGVNDLFDYESDRNNPRKGGAIEGGLIEPAGARTLWVAVAVTNLPFLAALAAVGGREAGIALTVTAFVALAYSVPPLRTKVIPGLDSATSSLHFVLPPLCGGLIAGAGFWALPWPFLLAFFLWGMASHALGAIQDVRYDREAGIGSIAVGLGARNTALFALCAYSVAVLVVALQGGAAVAAAVVLLPYVLLAASCLSGDAERQARRAWHGFLGLNLLTGFFITQILLRVWGAGNLSVLDLLAWGSAFGIIVLLAHTVANEWAMRRTSPLPDRLPPISVVTPARNEEASIEACLRGVHGQRYDGEVELVVVDDGSTDQTAALARGAMRAGDRLLQPGSAPASWTGKCWAAHHGADAARGEVLVFLDADTVLEPDALTSLAAEIVRQGGLLSILTRYRMDGPAERTFIPAFVHMQACFLPIAWMNAPRRPLPPPAYAYGPCMVAWKHDYEACGGHAAIRASEREDVDLAALFSAAGHRVRFLRGADLASTRHYRSLSEVIGCWRRTYYAYAGGSLAVALLGMLGITTVFLLPLALPLAAVALGDLSALLGSLVGLAGLAGLRILLARRERQPLSTILWHPVTWLGTLAFQALGVLDGLRGIPLRWRGRALPAEAAR